jgi:hypothetical protein
MYREEEVSVKEIRALVKPSIISFLMNWLLRGKFMHNPFVINNIEKPDINAITLAGETVLHRAIFLGRDDIVAVLLHHQASLTIPDHNGLFPLHKAVNRVVREIPSFKEFFKESVELLLNNGADPNVQDFSGNTPLHFAASKGLVKVAELLINKGAQVNAQNKEGITPLSYAIKAAIQVKEAIVFKPIIHILSKNGADATIQDCWGKSVLEDVLVNNRWHLLRDVPRHYPVSNPFS